MIKKLIETHEGIQTEFCAKSESGLEQAGAEVETRYITISKKKKDGKPGCYLKLTINLYHSSSRILVNGSRVDLFMDVIFTELLNELKRLYSNIAVMNRTMNEAISKSLEEQSESIPVVRSLSIEPSQNEVNNSNERTMRQENSLIGVFAVRLKKASRTFMESMCWFQQTRPQTTLLLFDGYIILTL